MAFQTYEEAVKWITDRMAFGIRPGLKRMEYMMKKLDHPERRLRVIHVAGTNGKGSVCAMLTRMLIASGYDVGTFTSPYIESFTNRIQFNGEDIPREEVLRLANEIKPLADELENSELGAPTMFEVTTVLAILYFAKVTFPYYVVWEAGLGGRLDSTNIVHPTVTIITNIGHDHMDVLGDTLIDVAREKAGIIKAGVPLVSAATQPEVIELLEQTAKEKKAKLYLNGRDFGTRPSPSKEGNVFDFYSPFRTLKGIELSLVGDHQRENAAVALMVIDLLRQYNALVAEEEDFIPALKEVKWPGRLERISDMPPLLLDGAHNPEGAQALVKAIRDYFPHRKLHFMIGMLANKNHFEYLEHILPVADTIIVTEPDFRKKTPASDLAGLVSDLKEKTGSQCETVVEPDWKKALGLLKQRTANDDLAVVTGSLYLVSDVRSMLLDGTDSEKGW